MTNPLADALEELLALGVEGPALVAAMRRLETATYEKRIKTLEQAVADSAAREDAAMLAGKAKREKDADRKRQSRVSTDILGCPGTSADIHGPLPTYAQVVTPSLPSLRSEELVGGGGDAREPDPKPTDDWPAGKASDHVRLLIDAVASPRLDPMKSAGLVTTSGRLMAWKRDGASWEHDVVPVVTALCARQRTPVSTWKFFDQAIARSIGDNRAALEIPEARVVPFRATGPPRTIDERVSASWDEAEKRLAEDG